jgi:hypothetical protein
MIFRMLVPIVAALAGCSTAPLHKDTEEMTQAYHQVHTGSSRSVTVGNEVICLTSDGLQAVRKGADQYGNKISDREVLSSARGLIHADPALRGQPIEVSVNHGQIKLTGRVASDRQVVLAIEDVSGLGGSVGVLVKLTTPESPTPLAGARNLPGFCYF